MNDDCLPYRVFAGLPPALTTLDRSRVVILPVPYDGTTEYKTGAREGPRAIIDSSEYLELYDIELQREFSEVGIATLPEVQPATGDPKQMIARVRQIAKTFVDQGKLLVTLGGEHLMSLGPVEAFRHRYNDLSVLQFDAHADLRNEYQGSRYNNACVTRRLLEVCPVTLAGVRSYSLEEYEFIKKNHCRLFHAEDLTQHDLVSELISALSPTVYVSIDLDVLDPSIMSAVGTPEPGGLTWQQVIRIVGAVSRRRRIVGFDLMELCPREGTTSCAFLASRLAYKLIGYATCNQPDPTAGASSGV